MKNKLFILFFLCLLGHSAFSAEKIGEVKSPNGKVRIELTKESDGRIFYKVFSENTMLIKESQVSISTNLKSFSDCQFDAVMYNSIDESFQLYSGKKKIYANKCNELTATFKHSTGRFNLVFRAYNDGIAFRYNILDNFAYLLNIESEISEININDFGTSWAQKFAESEDYSEYYPQLTDWDELYNFSRGFFAPILVETNSKDYMLLTEADTDQNYAASKFMASPDQGKFYFYKMIKENIGNVQSTLPFNSPWRVVLLGHLPTIMESTILENLNPPTKMQKFDWIKPGKVSWSWGGEDAGNDGATSDFAMIKKYIDLASDTNWKYSLIDDGWEGSDANYTLKEAVDYAESKNVGIFVWSGQSRFPNDETGIRAILKPWKDAGIKGVKIDFFNRDDQTMMQKYEKIYKVTAELELMLNLHGCTKPTGRVRTWPHLLTTEAVFGGENYLHHSLVTPANHNIILTMTRNVLGSMDYTPGDFGNRKGQVRQLTTWSHQMALLTAYESALQHFVDCPENYNYHIGEGFFKILPTTWDDIRVLDAKPEQYATIARKNGNDWYIATLCNDARTVNIPMDFLEEGKQYYAYIYTDGTCKTDIAFDFKENITKNSSISLKLSATGGATVHVSTSPDFARPEVKLYEAESPINSLNNLAIWEDDMKLCSGNTMVGNIGMGKALTFNKIEAPKAGKYAITFFYMSGDSRNAYVRINGNESDIQNLAFNASEAYNGKGLAIKTIIVDLQKGYNTLEFGNKDGYAPNLDRIAVQSATKYSGWSGLLNATTGTIKAYGVKGGIEVSSEEPMQYKIFNIAGNIISRGNIMSGNNSILVDNRGVYILQLLSPKSKEAVKVIVQ